jgi:hypothetical protein
MRLNRPEDTPLSARTAFTLNRPTCTKVRRSTVTCGRERAGNGVRCSAWRFMFSLLRVVYVPPRAGGQGQDRTVDLPLFSLWYPCGDARSGRKIGCGCCPLTPTTPWPSRSFFSRVPGASSGPFNVAVSTWIRFLQRPDGSRGQQPLVSLRWSGRFMCWRRRRTARRSLRGSRTAARPGGGRDR